jgi:cytosine/adenosine deaminase-related metal-dependent hydrolase
VKAKLRHPFIALCPLSNIYIHDALPPVELLRGSGLTLTVGTDSLSSNDDLDMVSELFCLQENFPQVSLEEMLGWACTNGAAFLGKEDVLGRLVAGMRPGIVCIDHLADGARLTTASTSYRIR